jgi:transposase
MRVAAPIDLTVEQQEALEQCARARSLSVRLVERALIVLLASAGKQDKDIAGELGITAQKVARWRKRFLALGMAGLEKDAPRPGRSPSISAAKVKRVIQKTTQDKPAHQLTFISLRSVTAGKTE